MVYYLYQINGDNIMMTSTKAREITITVLNEYHNLVMEIIVDKISPLLDEAII